ncbi:hypothetical protein [Eremococcus coleocola]|uniref:hypothetical protein n=1 Tax=Eremococcus coleocola TaxID=88132 RepID=UPI00041A334E|nr:hypothetical protein [Eremococcus coleocola]
MAKSKRKKTQASQEEELELVDIFYIPKPMAEMYKVLRQSVRQEITEWVQDQNLQVTYWQDSEMGETIEGYDSQDKLVFSYALDPSHISEAQKARDKDQLATHLETFLPDQD